MTKRPVHSKAAKGKAPEPKLSIEDTLIAMDEASHPLKEHLDDPVFVQTIETLCSIGASIGTMAAKLGISDRSFRKWVKQGHEDSENELPTFSLQRELWDIISKGLADSRMMAEAALAKRNPEKFLTSKTMQLLGDDHVDEVEAQEYIPETMELGNNLIESFRVLRKQGVDINQIIDSGQIYLEAEKQDEQKTLEYRPDEE